MSQLTFSSSPTFADLADSAIGKNNVLTDDSIQKISKNAKFAAVRYEKIFMGFYKHGDTVSTPTSPVDGYAYGYSELFFDYVLYSTRAPDSNFISGQAAAPGISSNQGTSGKPNNPYWFTVDIANSTGVVSIGVNYDGTTTPTTDGIVKVYAYCQRAMSSIGAQPLFVEVPDDLLVVAQPVRERAANTGALIAISRNSKFGVVRKEVFYQGFWAGGYSVSLPTSPIDGYVYSRAEVRYKAILYSNMAPAGGFSNGQTDPPTLGDGKVARRTGVGPLYWWTADVEDKTGLTTSTVSYYVQDGHETQYAGDGIFKVYAICQRGSTNIAGPVTGGGTTPGVGGVSGGTGNNNDIPDPPVVGVLRSVERDASYHLTVGVDNPKNYTPFTAPLNWNFGTTMAGPPAPTQIQVSNDPTFVTFPAGKSWNPIQTFPIPPFTVEVPVDFPGTYYVRARVQNAFGWSSWATTQITTDLLDNVTDDTDLMAAVTPLLVTNSAGAQPGVAGNAIRAAFEVPVANSGTYFGYTVFTYSSGTLPTATKQDTGTHGAIVAGVAKLTDSTKSWTPGAWVGKDVVIFSSKRGGSPTFDYEGNIINARITANTSTEITFDASSANLHRNDSGMTYFIVNHGAGDHFWEKLQSCTPCIVDQGLTGGPTLDQSGRVRIQDLPGGNTSPYVWVVLYNIFGIGKAGSGQTATFGGVTSDEIKSAAVITAKIAGTAAGNGAVTAIKTNIVALGDITLTLGTVQTGKLQTASSVQRIEIDGTNGLRAFDSGGTLKTRLYLDGGLALAGSPGQMPYISDTNVGGDAYGVSFGPTYNPDTGTVSTSNLTASSTLTGATFSITAGGTLKFNTGSSANKLKWGSGGNEYLYGDSASNTGLVVGAAGGDVFAVDATVSSTQTNVTLSLNGSLKRVEVGANDSGGTGYRLLRVTN